MAWYEEAKRCRQADNTRLNNNPYPEIPLDKEMCFFVTGLNICSEATSLGIYGKQA